MATPSYLGQGQPSAASGGWLSNLFGGGTPSYAGAAQAAPRSSFFAIAPAYQTVATPQQSNDAAPPAQIAIVIPRQIVDPQT
ncbi:MAG TPA: hypothetical protein VGG74_01535 [Kofleriaceae bacterium]|jgi:hypothetical protein